jgi:tetratricopeptide (TPR) repeat protein
MRKRHSSHQRRPLAGSRDLESYAGTKVNSCANPSHSVATAPSLKNVLWVLLALTLLNLIIYAPSWNYGFLHYDDPLYVSENIEVSRGLTGQGVLWAFTTGHSANWHPLTWLSHMLDVQIYGMHAEYHRLTNVLLHLANSLLLFWVLCRATGSWGRSAIVAALFAVHPLHVESVAWVSERKDVLSTFLWVLTFYAYINYARHPILRRRAAVIVIFALGLMAKPMLVTLPFTLLLFDIWPLHRVSLESGQWRVWLQLIREKIPLFALSAASGIVAVIAQWEGGTVKSFDLLPLSFRAANAATSYAVYIGKMLWPINLVAYYPYKPVPGWLAAASLLGILIISSVVIRYARRFPYLLVGWLWYLCTLLPVIGLIQVGAQSKADRYTYLPLVGLFIVVSWGIPAVFQGRRHLTITLRVAAGILICVLTIAARNQVEYWKNDIGLWEHALRVSPDNYFARTSLGIALAAGGDSARAIEQYNESLRTRPDFAETHNALGAALFKQGLWREAMPHYTEALRLRPEFAEAHSNMGTVLGMQGRTEEAISEFLKSLKISPHNAEVIYNLGLSLAKQGKYEEAIAQYNEALKIKPMYAEAYNELGNALLLQGKIGEAINQYIKSLGIKPDFAKAHNNLGVALTRQERDEEAIMHFNEALRIDPNSAEARENLEIALAKRSAAPAR